MWTFLVPLVLLTFTYVLVPSAPAQGPSVANGLAKERGPDATPANSLGMKAPESVTTPTELLAMLAGVLALIGASAYGLRRFMRNARLAPGKERVLQLIDALPLGPKRHVWVVGYKDRTLVLGGGQDEISLLAEYSEDEFAAEQPEPEAKPSSIPQKPSKAREEPDLLDELPVVKTYRPERPNPAQRPAPNKSLPAAFQELLREEGAQS